jgi:hypothetical protein
MAKTFREALPEGRIVGFQWNNKWFGDPADAPEPGAAIKAALPTVKSEGSDEYDIHLYLTAINWDVDPTSYKSISSAFPDLDPLFDPDYFMTPLFMKIAMFVPDYSPGISCITTDTHQATLMDVIILAQDPTPTQYDPPNPAWTDPTTTTITAVMMTSDTNPQQNTIGDFLQGFTLQGKAIMPTSVISQPAQDEDGNWYVDYTGSDWLYFIGTPASRPFYYSGTHGSPYPKLRLDEFCVGAVPCMEGEPGVYDTRNFTLSYETRTDRIYFRTETIDGETVHTLIIPDKFK